MGSWEQGVSDTGIEYDLPESHPESVGGFTLTVKPIRRLSV
jgi:hypothetical protein